MHSTHAYISHAYTHALKAYEQLLFRYKYISLMKLHIRLTSLKSLLDLDLFVSLKLRMKFSF